MRAAAARPDFFVAGPYEWRRISYIPRMESTAGIGLDDPAIDRVWTEAAARCGFAVARGEAAYASTDGSGTILIGARHTLDANDSLAQLVLHELCHALVQGEASWTRADWGLDNTDDRDAVREEACLRLQARLADRQGLRAAMAPTTEWRSYYHALSANPLQTGKDVGEDVGDARSAEACALAQTALALAERKGLARAIDKALTVTAALLRPKGAGQSGGLLPSRPAGQHPIGFKLGPASRPAARAPGDPRRPRSRRHARVSAPDPAPGVGTAKAIRRNGRPANP